MLGLVQNWLGPKASPIGIDFGSDALRMAQVQFVEGEPRLMAAASSDVPSHVRNDPSARMSFFVETVRDLLTQGKFRGREVMLGLPAASMFIQHLKLPKMDEEGTRKAIPWEARGKLPIDPSHAILRHIIAGEIYHDQEQRHEVICMAARKELVKQLLQSAAKARLDIIGMNVEPRAIIDCFKHVYRRKTDIESTTCWIDIGSSGTRATIARGPQILFARSIPIGGDHFNRAVADAMKTPLDEAKVFRIKSASSEADPYPENHDAAPAASPNSHASACADVVARLVEELDWCRRYHEATFPKFPIDKLIFLGGEARQKQLCQDIARGMGLPAQLGDPMARMSKTSDLPIESGIDRRLPQPSWTVALGLSMGAVGSQGSFAAPAAVSKERV